MEGGGWFGEFLSKDCSGEASLKFPFSYQVCPQLHFQSIKTQRKGSKSSKFCSKNKLHHYFWFFMGQVLQIVFCSLQFFSSQRILLVCVCSFPDSSFSTCIEEVLEARKQEFKRLEEQKEQRRSFLRLCRGVEDMIKGTGWVHEAGFSGEMCPVLLWVMRELINFRARLCGDTHDMSFLLSPRGLVDRSTMERSIRDNGSIKDQLSVQKFSLDGKSETESHILDNYCDMLQKLSIVEKSQFFLRLWKMRAEQTKATIPEDQVFSIDDVQEKIYKPAIADFKKTYLSLKDFSITLGAVQSNFENLLGEKLRLQEEFEIIEKSEGPGHGRGQWIAGAAERIENYLTLSKVVNTAKVIDELRQMLQLEGDFQVLSDLTKYVRRGCVDCSWENPQR